MNPQPDPLIPGMRLAACLLAILLFSSLFVGCSSTLQMPDPSLFPKESKTYNDGYRAGFNQGFSEALGFNIISQ